MNFFINNRKNVHNWNFYKEPKEIEKELLPCPFCGNEDIEFALYHPQYYGAPDMAYWCYWGINCTECGANFELGADSDDPNDPGWEKARIEIVEAWNRRVNDEMR